MSHTTGEDLTGSVTMSLTRYHELMTKAQQTDMLPELRERRDKMENVAVKLEDALKIAIEYIDNVLPMAMVARPDEFHFRIKQIGIKAEWVPVVRKDGHGVRNEVKISFI